MREIIQAFLDWREEAAMTGVEPTLDNYLRDRERVALLDRLRQINELTWGGGDIDPHERLRRISELSDPA